jgi:hypothetical protein
MDATLNSTYLSIRIVSRRWTLEDHSKVQELA